MNFNLHESLDAKAQRLFNALEPGTILPIHRHRNTAETYILLRGRMNVIFYNEDGSISEKKEINPLKGIYGAHIEKGQWHTLEVLESGTVLFEVKDGPYIPFQPEDVMQL
ncbi:MAG: WbuC family cupin fold metalloprotein, partial [Bacteroidaceae bacterium]|nr:WbuC family cupin fold metalloprotein [Bacteroidaceae bacterium]